MFRLKFSKRLINLFSKENIEHLLINNFREIIILVSITGLFVVVLIIFILSFRTSKNIKYSEMKNDEAITNNREVSDKKEVKKNNKFLAKDILITSSDFIIPEISSFDLTSDYIDFLSAKQFSMPDKNFIIDNYKIMLDDNFEESLKFDFEKRK